MPPPEPTGLRSRFRIASRSVVREKIGFVFKPILTHPGLSPGSISIQPFAKQDEIFWLKVTAPRGPSSSATQSLETCVVLASSACDVLTHLKEEFPTFGQPEIRFQESPPGTNGRPQPLSSLTIAEFIRSDQPATIQFARGLNLHLDTAAVKTRLREADAKHASLEKELAWLVRMDESIERKVGTSIAVLKWSGLIYITGQLGAIIFLTQQLGWDLMGNISLVLLVIARADTASFFCLKNQFLTSLR
ncbi:hypothetical protein HKX48_003860 [Thoreauomyces humboldtii]|nr:hypothetical protein HKX48_003860 [Thoreauomyces humboldtii]